VTSGVAAPSVVLPSVEYLRVSLLVLLCCWFCWRFVYVKPALSLSCGCSLCCNYVAATPLSYLCCDISGCASAEVTLCGSDAHIAV